MLLYTAAEMTLSRNWSDSEMQLPRISIVTPSFNQAKYLPETIESILNQRYPNLEYIVIDGGSTDGSVEIIKRYERHLAYWVSEKDSGQSGAINKGLAKCTGDLFNWINSDDLLFPGALQRIGNAFVRHPDAALIIGGNARSDETGKIIRVSAAPTRLTVTGSAWPSWAGQQSIFVSLNTMRRIGGVREDLHRIMDVELYHRVLSTGGRTVRVGGMVGLIREQPDSKGQARPLGGQPEKARVWNECGIAPHRVRLDLMKMRLWRLFDGSYARTLLAIWRWKDKMPWDNA